MKTIKLLLTCLTVVCCSFGCSNQNEAAKKTKLALESRLSTAEQAEIVAVIGERVITLRDLERQLNAQTPLLRDQYGNAQRKLLFLTELVRLQLLANEALVQKLDTDPMLQDRLTMLLADAMVDEVGRRALREQPVSETELQRLGTEEGIAADDLDGLSELRHKLVRQRKESAVKVLLESNQTAREIQFDDDAWMVFKTVHQKEKESAK